MSLEASCLRSSASSNVPKQRKKMVEVSKSDANVIKSVADVVTFILVSALLILKELAKLLVPKSYQRVKKLDGEVVLVTGGAGGIGRLVALRLAKLNATLVLWDVNVKGKSRFCGPPDFFLLVFARKKAHSLFVVIVIKKKIIIVLHNFLAGKNYNN